MTIVMTNVLIHSFDKTYVLVVTVSGYKTHDLVVALGYTFFQLCSKAEELSVKLIKLRRSFVKRHLVILTTHTSYTAFLVDVRCAVQNGHIPFFAAVCLR